jgi:hypothetical protein
MFMAVKLNSGKISQHATLSLSLDCTNDGDAKKCDKASDAGTKKVTAKDAGKKDGAMDNTQGAMLALAYNLFDRAVCDCNMTHAADGYCTTAPYKKEKIDCIEQAVNAVSDKGNVRSKVACDVKAITQATQACTASCSTNCTTQKVGDALRSEGSNAGCTLTIPALDACFAGGLLGDAGTKDAGAKTDAGAK